MGCNPTNNFAENFYLTKITLKDLTSFVWTDRAVARGGAGGVPPVFPPNFVTTDAS